MNLTELLHDEIRRHGSSVKKTKEKPVFDSAGGDDFSENDTSSYTFHDIAIKTAAAIQQWAETNDLGGGETYANRLFALMIGVADENQDGEISEDEQMVMDAVLNTAFDYLLRHGAAEEDVDILLNDWDDSAGDRVRELLISALPEGDAAGDDINSFAFGSDQGAVFDAAYKVKMVVHGGRKMRMRKRVSGTVHRSGAQKLAMRKAQMKSHSATAMMHRAKSMKVRHTMGK